MTDSISQRIRQPRRLRKVRLWVVNVVVVLLVISLASVAYAALLSFGAWEIAKFVESQIETEASAARSRIVALRVSFKQQKDAFAREEEALQQEGYWPADAEPGVYWRAGTLETVVPDAYCEIFESCALIAFRTNSFTECPNGVSIETIGSAGDVMAGVTESLPKNGAVQIEIEWFGPSEASKISKMQCH